MGARDNGEKRKQRKHSNYNRKSPHSTNNNGNSRRDGSCSRSNALAMMDAPTAVVEKTTTGVLKLKKMLPEDELLFTVVNVKRQTTKDAGSASDLTVLRIISDPTAARICLGAIELSAVSGHSVNAPNAPCLLLRKRPLRSTPFSTALIFSLVVESTVRGAEHGIFPQIHGFRGEVSLWQRD